MASTFQKFECYTSKKTEKAALRIEWKVQRDVIDSLFKEEEGSRRSTSFKANFYESSWFLSLSHNAEDSMDNLALFLYLEKASIPFNDILAHCTFTLKEHQQQIECKDFEIKFNKWHNDMNLGRGFREWITKEELYQDIYWDNNYITIEAIVQVKVEGDEMVSNKEPSVSQVAAENCIEEKYSRLLQNGAFSDVILRVCEKKFKAHRCILAVSCEYFDAMFKGSFKESTDEEVEITDIEPDVFEVILQYIYTNQLSNDLGPITRDVLASAHKYGLQAVVDNCEEQLCADVNLTNCVDLLIFADLFNQERLIEKLVSFLKANLVEVCESESWKELERNYINLAYKTLKAAVL